MVQIKDSGAENDVRKDFSMNTVFQSVLSKPDSDQRRLEFVQAADRFLAVAVKHALTIVKELSLPHDQKTLKPVNAGGTAGGHKYCVEGNFQFFSTYFFAAHVD